MDKQKKKLILAGGMALLLVVLLVISSSLKKARRTIPAENRVELSLEHTAAPQEARDNLDEAWDRMDDDPIKKKRNDFRPAATAQADEADIFLQSEVEKIFKAYPAPSFVSTGGDTLIYENGIYIRIDWVDPPKVGPDTVEINGRRYVEILE